MFIYLFPHASCADKINQKVSQVAPVDGIPTVKSKIHIVEGTTERNVGPPMAEAPIGGRIEARLPPGSSLIPPVAAARPRTFQESTAMERERSRGRSEGGQQRHHTPPRGSVCGRHGTSRVEVDTGMRRRRSIVNRQRRYFQRDRGNSGTRSRDRRPRSRSRAGSDPPEEIIAKMKRFMDRFDSHSY